MHITIVTPVFQDWASFERLVMEIDKAVTGAASLDGINFDIMAVDDGSTDRHPCETREWAGLTRLQRIAALRLAVNLGHQRAIALGIVRVVDEGIADAVVVMDSDGEDLPLDVVRLVEAHLAQPHCIVLAQRSKRSESLAFRAGYRIYRTLYRTLTGHSLPFGNFSLVPREALASLVCSSDLWNHFAAAISRSRRPVTLIKTSRGIRYAGKSQMNWVSLVIHGLSAMSVHSDRVATRLIAASAMAILISIGAIAGVVAIRFLTDLAIPGWASQVAGTFILLSIFSIGFATLLAFITLQSRQNVAFVPKVHGAAYIRQTEIWHPSTTATPARN